MTIKEIEQEYNLKLNKLLEEQKELERQSKIEAKQNKLIENRVKATAKEKVLRIYEKDYSFCPKFISQLSYFQIRYDKWVNAKDLDYMTEMDLIGQIGIQYTSCIDVLTVDIRGNPLGFYNKFIALEKKVSELEKLIKK
ncbi:hypothetical protein LCGC14_0933230 [marine sediment metagenome]|uniref:Uncharacterized protein n=1 Tax=marine sediment metagenome TaxID=412755 RepID=A0A0F9RTU9_9ZZZZ